MSERYTAGRDRLRQILADTVTSDPCRLTVYLSPAALASAGDLAVRARKAGLDEELAAATRYGGKSDTGLVSFWWDDRALLVVPPFPLDAVSFTDGADPAQLEELLGKRPLLSVILLRLGRYAIGVLHGDKLVASKSGSRYVKSRHRAGGSSQRRFERSRERLVRELFDKACEVAREVFAPWDERIEYLLLGGERHTLEAFARRCALVRGPGPVRLQRVLQVDRPGRAAMEQIHREVWKSRVIVLARDDQE